jgi:hypothetical protein
MPLSEGAKASELKQTFLDNYDFVFNRMHNGREAKRKKENWQERLDNISFAKKVNKPIRKVKISK